MTGCAAAPRHRTSRARRPGAPRLRAASATPRANILETAGLDGAFVWTFADPQWTFSDDPRFDLDMAAASLVKSYSRGHGTTYPDMTWEPKESFRAVADFYAAGHVDMPSA
jgi:hypothetical protein